MKSNKYILAILMIIITSMVSIKICSQTTVQDLSRIAGLDYSGLKLDSTTETSQRSLSKQVTFQAPSYSTDVNPSIQSQYVDLQKDSTFINKIQPLSRILPTATINTSLSVGQINYTSGVSPTGSSYINIPIELPESPTGLTPQLSFTYNSLMGKSPLGLGWSLQGPQSIIRANKSIYYDTGVNAITNVDTDAFALSGMRLIETGRTNTEVSYISEQGNIKVTGYKKTINSKANISHFKVYYPNGNTATFGFTDETKPIIEYPITELKDSRGNTCVFEYESFSSLGPQYRITQIKYGRNKEYSVSFKYKGTGDVGKYEQYISGNTFIKDYLIEYVNINYKSINLRTYQLTLPARGNFRILSSIKLKSGNSTFNSLDFNYGDGQQKNQFINKGIVQLDRGYDFSDPNQLKIVRGKFEYGSPDDGIIQLPARSPYIEYFDTRARINYIGNDYENNKPIIITTGISGGKYKTSEIVTEDGFIDIFCANINKSQEEEIIKVNNYISSTPNTEDVKFSIYNSDIYSGLIKKYTRTFSLPLIITSQAGKKSITPKFYFTGDFDGDGITEILAVSCENAIRTFKNTTTVYLFDLENNKKLYEGKPFSYKTTFDPSNDSYTVNSMSDKLFVGDFNGDGKSDICVINSLGMFIYSFTKSSSGYSISTIKTNTKINRDTHKDCLIFPSDLNGDGLMDLLISPPAKNYSTFLWKALISKGDGSFQEKNINIPNASYKDHISYYCQDINHDGVTDLIMTDKSGSDYTKLTVYLLQESKIIGQNTFNLTKNSASIPINLQTWNSFSSIIAITPKDRYVQRVGYNYDYGKDLAIKSFTDSFGKTMEFTYNRLNESRVIPGMGSFPIYEKGDGASFPFFNFADEGMLIASEAKQINQGKVVDHVRYTYRNLIIHKQGLGLQGFSSITEDNLTNQTKGVTKYFDPYNFGVLKRELSLQPTIFDNTYEYNIIKNSNKTKRITLRKKTQKDLQKGFTITTSYTYDSYDNPLTEIVDYGNNIKSSTENIYNNHVAGFYLLGQLKTNKIKNERGGTSVIEETSYTYDNKGNPLSKKKTFNNNLISEEEYKYSTLFDLTEKRHKAYTSTDWLSNKYQYDENGRLINETDPLGLSITYVYNNRDYLSERKDHKGNSTKYEYDVWDRLIKTTHPDNIIESTTYSWTSNPTNAIYSITETITGSPTKQTFFDALGREIRSGEMRFDGKYMYVDKIYNDIGLIQKESLPFKGSSPTLWNTFGYDFYGRLATLTHASGKKDTYSYNKNKITEVKDGISSTKTADATGLVTSVSDSSGVINYTYRPDKQLLSVSPSGVEKTSFEYNTLGQKTKMIDPSAGTITWTYDQYGNIHKETHGGNKTTIFTHDKFGRLTKKEVTGQPTTSYTYTADDLPLKVSNTNKTIDYTYDTLLRLKTVTETSVDGKWFKKTYNYTLGNITSIVYTSNSGLNTTEYLTFTYGHLTERKLNGTSIWKLTNENDLGLPISTITGTLTRTYEYDKYGFPKARIVKNNNSTVIQNVGYDFDAMTGNLLLRADYTKGLQEDFTYDSLNRLTGFNKNKVKYDKKGNIIEKSDVGKFEYKNTTKPYQVTSVSTALKDFSDKQLVSYNTLRRPATITENGYIGSFVYDDEGNRVRYQLKKGTTTQLTRYYLGGQYEYETGTAGTKERLYIDGDAYSASSVYVKEGSAAWTINYICRDYIGSITHITNASGGIRQELSYDPWGRLRNPVNQKLYEVGEAPTLLYGRGYTGHEHHVEFNLINMNARLYDPVIGRFLSPDPFIQAPFMSQNFNRYSYALNNPLKYTDPNGEFIHIIIGAVVGGVANWAIHGFRFDTKGLAAFGIGAVGGAVGAATFGVGMAAMGGAGLFAGMGAGAFSYAATTPILNVGNHIAFGDRIMTAGEYFTGLGLAVFTSGLMSGLDSTLKGNNFFTGKPSDLELINEIQVASILEGQSTPMPAVRNIDDVLMERIGQKSVNSYLDGKTIGLGINEDLRNFRGTSAITWKDAGWQKANLTSVDWGKALIDKYHFQQSFKDAATNAVAIKFDVSNFKLNFSRPGMTNFEFNTIINNRQLFQKTTFIQNGIQVRWNGKNFY